MDPFSFYSLINNAVGLGQKAYNYFQPSQPLASPVPQQPKPAPAPVYSGPVIPGTSVQSFRTTGQDPAVLGASTAYSPGGTAPRAATTAGVNVPDNSVDLATQAYQNRLNAVRGLFDQTKAQAANVRSEAAKTFADLIDAVTRFRDRSKEQYGNAGQEITNRASEILGSNARTAQEAIGTSRALGRAMGLGDSSKFNQQNKVISSLAGTQGSTIARKGEQEAANTSLYNTRLDQAQNQENEAGRYKTAVEEQARQLESRGLDQFGDNVDQASNDLGQSLNSIIQYQRQLAAINPLQADSLTSYNPNFTGIVNTLNGVLPTAGATAANPNGAANAAIDPTLAAYLKKNQGLYYQ